VERYEKGEFKRQFHQHVPKSRLSNERRINLLRALVSRFSDMGAEAIVRCHLNTRGKTPPADDHSLRFVVSYPEQGVLRSYCGINTKAWSDEVVLPSEFRRQGETTPSAG
jgi:hypothetical protein